jgi:iron complex transport system substrate-binding protein
MDVVVSQAPAEALVDQQIALTHSAPGRPGPDRRHAASLRVVLRALALVAVLTAAAASAAAGVVDDLGRTVAPPDPVVRIVSMVPSHTEVVCALGRCDALVGRDSLSNHPARVEALPDLGSAFAPDLEALVALEPDLVLVDEYSGLAEALAPLGIAVYAGTPQRLEEVFELFDRLGRLLDARSEAEELVASVRGRIEAVAAATATLAPRRVYYEIDASPYSVGPDGFIGSLISLAGGANIVVPELGDFPLLDPEYVVAADPDVIVLANAPYGESLETLRARPGWGGLAAVTSGGVVELTAEQADVMSRPGPRVADAVELLARIFHPERF